MTRIWIKMVTGDTFIYESELPEDLAWGALEKFLADGEMIDFASGRWALNVAHIVSVGILA